MEGYEAISRSRIHWMTPLILFMLLFVLAPVLSAEEQALTREFDDSDIEWGPCPAFMPDSCSLALLHGNPQAPNTDVLFRLEGNTSVPLHWHTSAERMVLLEGELLVDYEGQDPVIMRPSMYAYGPPELPHTAECRSSGPCVLFIAFNEPVDAFEGAHNGSE